MTTTTSPVDTRHLAELFGAVLAEQFDHLPLQSVPMPEMLAVLKELAEARDAGWPPFAGTLAKLCRCCVWLCDNAPHETAAVRALRDETEWASAALRLLYDARSG